MPLIKTKKISYNKSSETKGSHEDFQHLLSQYKDTILELSDKLTKTQEQNGILLESVGSMSSENENLRNKIKELESKLREQTATLDEANFQNKKLRHNNLCLQEENELLVGRGSNVVSKLMRFCQVIKSMEVSSIDECIAAIKSEIEQLAFHLGFDIVETIDGGFNPKLHRIVGTKDVDDILLNNQIAEIVRPGIWYNNKCLIPQDIIVYTAKE